MDNTNYYLKLGIVIKELREKQNMSLKQLSEGICSYSYLTRIESGQRCPNSVILRQLSNKLGVSTDYLFRIIESPKGLQTKEILDKLIAHYRRNDFITIHDIIKESNDDVEFSSITDFQVYKCLEIMSNTFKNHNYKVGYDELQDILFLTYNKGTIPNETEFSIMHNYAFLLLIDKKYMDSYTYLKEMETYIDEIHFSQDLSILTKFYLHLATSCVDMKEYDEANYYIDIAINKCKYSNNHYYLTYLFFLKSEIFFSLNKIHEYHAWYNKALSLYELIKESHRDFYDGYIGKRLEKISVYNH